MKICIVCPFDVHPPTFGGSVRINKVAEALANQGHRVFLLMPGNESKTYLQDKLHIHKVVPSVYISVLDVFRKIRLGGANDIQNFNLSLLHSLLSMVLREGVDVIQSEGLRVGLISLLVSMITRKPLILSKHNVEFHLSYRFSNTWLHRIYIYILERILCRLCDKVVAVSESDKQDLCRLYGLHVSKVSVIPNGVDLQNCLSSKKLSRTQLGLPKGPLVVFHGKPNYPPNTFAVKEITMKIAPLVREKLSDAHFIIIGKTPPLEFRSDAIIFLGFIKDLNSYLKTADVALVPIRLGSGTRLKILEYFACGVPVVTTSVGSEGIPIVYDKHALIGDTSEELADALVAVLTNRELSLTLSSNAMKFIKSYDWNTLVAKYNDILNLIAS